MKYSSLILVISAITVISCGKKEDAASPRSIVNVEVKKADSVSLGHGVTFSGQVEPVLQSVVSTRIMGQISKVYVKEGELVGKGDLLVSIRSNDIKARQQQVVASIDEVKAAYENAKNDFQRFQKLYGAGSASKKELEDMTTRYKMAEARLASVSTMENELDEMVSYADVRAPYSGVVTQKFLNEGDMASPGMPLLAIENNSQFKIVFLVPESEINFIQLGDSLSVTVHAIGQSANGVVSEVSPSRIHSGGQFKVEAFLDASSLKLVKSGMNVAVAPYHLQKKSVSVLRNALVFRGQLTGLWCVSDQGLAVLRWVRTGLLTEHQAEILSGLSVGDTYISSTSGRLYDGAKVQIN